METVSKLILRERKIKVLFFAALNFLLLGIIFLVPYLLLSVILSIVIYYILQPVVDYLENKGLKRYLASGIPFLGSTIIIAISTNHFLPILISQIDDLSKLSPSYLITFKEFGISLEKKLNPFLQYAGNENLIDKLQSFILVKVSEFMNKLPEFFSGALTIFFLTPFFAFFLLLDGKLVYRNFLRLVPNHIFETMIRVNHEINIQMGQFIRARLIESVLVGLMIMAGLNLINFPYSLLLSIFAALLNLIPYIGPFIGALPAIILTFVSPEFSIQLNTVLLIYLVTQLFDTVFLVPFLVAKIVNLHPVIVVLSVLIGAQLLGIMGMIISIPIMSILKIISEAIYKHLTGFNSSR